MPEKQKFNLLTFEDLQNLQDALNRNYLLEPYHFFIHNDPSTARIELALSGKPLISQSYQSYSNMWSEQDNFVVEATLMRMLKGILHFNGFRLAPFHQLDKSIVDLAFAEQTQAKCTFSTQLWYRMPMLWSTRTAKDRPWHRMPTPPPPFQWIEVDEAIILPLNSRFEGPQGELCDCSELIALVHGMTRGYKTITPTGLQDFTPPWQNPDVFKENFDVPPGGWP